MGQKKQSNKTIRGLVLELKPDNAQKLLLSKHLNGCRFIYNQYVEEYLKSLKENRLPNYKDYKSINLLKAGEYYFQNKTLGKELSEYKTFKCLDFQDQKHLNYN